MKIASTVFKVLIGLGAATAVAQELPEAPGCEKKIGLEVLQQDRMDGLALADAKQEKRNVQGIVAPLALAMENNAGSPVEKLNAILIGNMGFSYGGTKLHLYEAIDQKKLDCDNGAFVLVDAAREAGYGADYIIGQAHMSARITLPDKTQIRVDFTSMGYVAIPYIEMPGEVVTPSADTASYVVFENMAIRRKNGGNLKEAEKSIDKAISLAPNANQLYSRKAELKMLEKDTASALPLYEKAVLLDSNSYINQYNAAMIETWRGNRIAAQKHAKKAAQLNPVGGLLLQRDLRVASRRR